MGEGAMHLRTAGDPNRQPCSRRRDTPRPSCRLCGDDLRYSLRGERVCSCGWEVPAALRALVPESPL